MNIVVETTEYNVSVDETDFNVTVSSPTQTVEILVPAGSITDHGLLTGLSDNDHPQYTLTTKIGAITFDDDAVGDKKVLTYDLANTKIIFATPKVGTKEVDETDIGNGKILKYNSTSGKLEYETESAGHTQGTDQYLDYGGANQVAVADVKSAVTNNHAVTLLGTKTVDEANIGDGKVLSYVASSGKLEYITPTAGHTQNTDQYLDFGGANQVAVADVKSAITNSHAATLVGTKTVDEANIADGKVLAYVTSSGKLEYVAAGGHTQNTDTGTSNSTFAINTSVVLKNSSGNLRVENASSSLINLSCNNIYAGGTASLTGVVNDGDGVGGFFWKYYKAITTTNIKFKQNCSTIYSLGSTLNLYAIDVDNSVFKKYEVPNETNTSLTFPTITGTFIGIYAANIASSYIYLLSYSGSVLYCQRYNIDTGNWSSLGNYTMTDITAFTSDRYAAYTDDVYIYFIMYDSSAGSSKVYKFSCSSFSYSTSYYVSSSTQKKVHVERGIAGAGSGGTYLVVGRVGTETSVFQDVGCLTSFLTAETFDSTYYEHTSNDSTVFSFGTYYIALYFNGYFYIYSKSSYTFVSIIPIKKFWTSSFLFFGNSTYIYVLTDSAKVFRYRYV